MANRSNKQGKDQQVIQGVQKDLSTMSSLLLGAETFTPATLVAFVQSRIDAGNKVGTARAAWLDAVKAYEAVDTQADVVVHDLKQLVIAAFGATSVKLADFGFAPRKVTVLTPAQKAAAALKRKATRAARNTLGPKAKLAIKGTVTTTAPATAATPAAPAGQTAPVTAPNGTPPAATPATPGQAPTVTVNVTTAPAAQTAQTVASPATAPEPTQTPAGAQATTKA